MVNLTDFIKESLNHNKENLSLYESVLENINEDEYNYINEGLISFFKNLWSKFKNLFSSNTDVLDNIHRIEDNKLRSNMTTLLALSLDDIKSDEDNNLLDLKKEIKTILSSKKYGDDLEKNIIKVGNNLLTSLPNDSTLPLVVQAVLNDCTGEEAKILAKKLKTAIKKKYDENNIVEGSKRIKKIQNDINPKILKKLKNTKNNKK